MVSHRFGAMTETGLAELLLPLCELDVVALDQLVPSDLVCPFGNGAFDSPGTQFGARAGM